MSHDYSLSSMQETLSSLRKGQLAIPVFCQAWRARVEVLAALPPRYEQVMEDLLGRLEAGSLFTEESCSFSHEDLHSHLAIWLDKAAQTLRATGM